MTEIIEYNVTEAALAGLREHYQGRVYEVATVAGRALATAARAELRDYRLALEAKRVEIKSPALERCRLIDAEAKRITAELRTLEDPIDAQIKADEARRAAEKAAKEKAELERLRVVAAALEAERRAEEEAQLARRRAELEAQAAEQRMADEAARLARTEADRVAAAERAEADRAAREAREEQRMAGERAMAEAAWKQAEIARLEAERQAAARAELEAQVAELREEEQRYARERAMVEAAAQARWRLEEAEHIASATLENAARDALGLLRASGLGDHLVTRALAAALERIACSPAEAEEQNRLRDAEWDARAEAETYEGAP